MEKYTCVLEGQNSRLSITYNFIPKIIFRQLWKACQKLWKVLTIFILCLKLDSTKISHFNNNKCKSTREVAGLLCVLSSQEIVQTVNAYAIVQPSEDINNFINQVNALLTFTKRSMASMGKDSNQEDPTEPDTPDTQETPEGGTTTETSA